MNKYLNVKKILIMIPWTGGLTALVPSSTRSVPQRLEMIMPQMLQKIVPQKLEKIYFMSV